MRQKTAVLLDLEPRDGVFRPPHLLTYPLHPQESTSEPLHASNREFARGGRQEEDNAS